MKTETVNGRTVRVGKVNKRVYRIGRDAFGEWQEVRGGSVRIVHVWTTYRDAINDRGERDRIELTATGDDAETALREFHPTFRVTTAATAETTF